jgi:GNAT superfamily N-acetyltransferase
MPDRSTLTDADGTPIATYIPRRRDNRDVADYLELEVDLERAVPVILARLRGYRIAGSEALGHALIAAGATRRRHAHEYEHDLQDERPLPDPPPGLRFTPADRPAADLVDAYRAAHPPGHPDLVEGEDVEAELHGHLSGPLLDCSGLAVDAEGNVVAAILIDDMPGEGPWIVELFRDPGHRGAGRALLARALALADGLPSLKLTVTHGNPAERLYQELGFRRIYTTLSVDL